MGIVLTIILLYVAALFGISFYAKKVTGEGKESFLLAGRKLTTPLVAVTITGLAIGGTSTIGVSEWAFAKGISAGWYNVAWGAGAILMGLVVAQRYRKLKITTISEIFEKYYNKQSRIVCVLGQVIIQMAITSLQYVAGGAILASMLPDIFTLRSGIVFSAAVFIGITCIGGMMTVGLTNVLNIALIYIGIVVSTVAIIIKGNGLTGIMAKLPAEIPFMNPFKGMGAVAILGWFVVMITQCFSLQGVVQISFSAKNEKAARNGFVIGGLMMMPIGFLSALMGIAARAAYPDIKATLALPQIIMSLSPILAGLTLAALWAANVSTACGLLLGSATLFSQDIYKRFVNSKIDDRKLALINKVFVMVLGITTFALALNVVEILRTIMIALSLTTAFTVVLLFTFFAPKFCRKSSAFYTTIAGIVVLVLWQFVPEIKAYTGLPHVIYLEWIVCVATFLLIAAIDRTPIKNVLEVEGSEEVTA